MIENLRGWIGACGLVAMLLTAGARAQGESDDEIAGIRIGQSLRLLPSLGTRAWFTDNRFRSQTGETSETGLRFEPALILSYSPSVGMYKLGYKGMVDPIVEDDYNDREFFLSGDVRPLNRHRLEFDARHQHSHDELGVGRTDNALNLESLELDEWDESSAHGQYTFGASEARMNLSVRGGVADRDYTTNEDQGTRFLDHRATLVGGGATYRVGPKTHLVLDLSHQEFEYDLNAAPTYDSTLERALVGVRWVATAKTTGELLVGYYDRNFESNLRQDVDGVDWRARVIWGPATRTQITLSTGRQIRETHLLGENFINTQFYQATWRQDWTSRLYSDLTGTAYKADFEGTLRDDDSTQFGATLFFEMSRNVTIKAGLEVTHRDSSINTLDYDRNILFQGFEFVF